jgi:hypothetical protein
VLASPTSAKNWGCLNAFRTYWRQKPQPSNLLAQIIHLTHMKAALGRLFDSLRSILGVKGKASSAFLRNVLALLVLSDTKVRNCERTCLGEFGIAAASQERERKI